ncbi:restriction endonuclease subunit S [Veillonella sp. AM51-8BH]|uniref:restriction endonuclease subunit S n=1 Tax=Veillonella sp. AM51-8BH TaxID=2292378 RepID=UPI000E5CD517|nr:restriction endonuclease subunit S [Veillonella sp. AM51-8BH]RGZ21574.1 restriction endonuclease subunit S [Veillonella sp. AM51-8BH]
MTPDQLKISILQYAFEGKLVEQRRQEGNAEKLYQEIQDEKCKLIKEGKLKRGKAIAAIVEDEIPFCIPDSWKWCRLGELFSHVSGKALNAKNTKGEKHKYITTSNVYWDYFDLTNLKEMYYTVDEIEKYSVKYGDLLVLEGGDVGRSAIWNLTESYCIQNHIHRLRPYINICVKYFYYVMMYFKHKGHILGKGIGIKGLSAMGLRSINVPLPPREEQYRIVARIEELFSLITQYEKLWDKLENLNKKFPNDIQKSILKAATQGKLSTQLSEDGISETFFEEIQQKKKLLVEKKLLKKQMLLSKITDEEIPFKLPDTWKWVRLGSLINFSIGKTPPRGESEWWGNDFPWVSIADMSDYGYIKETKEMVSKKALDDKFSSISKAGTLLMSFKLTVGRTSILDCDAVHNEAIISIMPYVDHDNSFRDYLFYVLPFLTQWGDSRNAIKGKTLNSKSISNLLIPLPPLAEQKRIVERIKQILPFINQCKI